MTRVPAESQRGRRLPKSHVASGAAGTALFLLAALSAGACAARSPGSDQGGPAEERGIGAVGDVLTRVQIERIHADRMDQLFDTFTGVQVTYLNGELALRIRGLGEPLLVIDDVPQSTFRVLWGMNPRDVERIEIVKDAATSLYGFRGANGAVLITTRRL